MSSLKYSRSSRSKSKSKSKSGSRKSSRKSSRRSSRKSSRLSMRSMPRSSQSKNVDAQSKKFVDKAKDHVKKNAKYYKAAGLALGSVVGVLALKKALKNNTNPRVVGIKNAVANMKNRVSNTLRAAWERVSGRGRVQAPVADPVA